MWPPQSSYFAALPALRPARRFLVCTKKVHMYVGLLKPVYLILAISHFYWLHRFWKTNEALCRARHFDRGGVEVWRGQGARGEGPGVSAAFLKKEVRSTSRMWFLNPRGANPLRSGLLATELASHQQRQQCSKRGRSLSVSAAQHSTRIRSGRRFVVEGPRSIGVIGSYRWNGNISTSRGQGRRYRSTQPAPADRGALLRRMARYIEEDPGAADKLGKAVSTSNARTRISHTPALFASHVLWTKRTNIQPSIRWRPAVQPPFHRCRENVCHVEVHIM